jgi:hypothetical protein
LLETSYWSWHFFFLSGFAFWLNWPEFSVSLVSVQIYFMNVVCEHCVPQWILGPDFQYHSNVPQLPLKRKGKKNVNFSRMFLTIVIIYLLSYIPTGKMFFGKSKKKLYWHKLWDFQLSLQLLILRFNIVTNIVNTLFIDILISNFVNTWNRCSMENIHPNLLNRWRPLIAPHTTCY